MASGSDNEGKSLDKGKQPAVNTEAGSGYEGENEAGCGYGGGNGAGSDNEGKSQDKGKGKEVVSSSETSPAVPS